MQIDIDRIINEVLGADEEREYHISYSDEDGELQINEALDIGLIRDLLLGYYYHGTDHAVVCKALVQNCDIDPLDAIELVGAVDDLKTNKKTDLP